MCISTVCSILPATHPICHPYGRALGPLTSRVLRAIANSLNWKLGIYITAGILHMQEYFCVVQITLLLKITEILKICISHFSRVFCVLLEHILDVQKNLDCIHLRPECRKCFMQAAIFLLFACLNSAISHFRQST